MNIAVFDPYKGKFFQDVVNRWESEGHEVRYERYYNPDNVQWADVVWFETCDNNFHVASTGDIHGEDQEAKDGKIWDMHKMDLSNKKVIVRVIDIEAWYGHHNGGDWNLITDVVFIAPHIRKVVEKDIDFGIFDINIHEIPCGVNMNRFTASDKLDSKKIAWVCERWPTKGIDYMLQIMAMLPKDYELHALGAWNDRYPWEQAYQEDFIKRHGISYYEYDWVDDINEWYQDKGIILSTSKKEGFGYSIAEGMAVGAQPVIHHFYGAEHIWPDITWDTVDEAVKQITDAPTWDTRYWLEEHGYTFDTMYKRFMKEVIRE